MIESGRMRVLIVTNMYPTDEAPYYGIFVKEQVDELRRQGIDVGVELQLGRESKINYIRGLFSLARRLRTEQWDILHSHHTFSTIIALAARRMAGRASGPRRIPLIQSFHEGEVFAPPPRRRHLRDISRLKAYALLHADGLLPVERRMVAAVLASAGYPADAADSIPKRVIPAGIDLSRFRAEAPRLARERLGWQRRESGPWLFFPYAPGKPAKRADLARAAYQHLLRTMPEAQLVLGGAIPYEAMPDHLQASDVVLALSDYEASPTIVKEAVACERPVVATDVGDIREQYGDLPGVAIAEPDPAAIVAAIERVLAVGRRGPFGGRDRLRQLGLETETVAHRIIEFYEECLALGNRDRKGG